MPNTYRSCYYCKEKFSIAVVPHLKLHRPDKNARYFCSDECFDKTTSKYTSPFWFLQAEGIVLIITDEEVAARIPYLKCNVCRMDVNEGGALRVNSPKLDLIACDKICFEDVAKKWPTYLKFFLHLGVVERVVP